jgi:hypothetical protein
VPMERIRVGKPAHSAPVSTPSEVSY